MSVKVTSNLDKARSAWGSDLPEWVSLLATACDRTSQRTVADQLSKSGGYISRLINRAYAGSYPEAEQQVRAHYGTDRVDCPLWGAIPLKSCIRQRRRTDPPNNHMRHAAARTCPTCPNNTDREEI